MVVVEWDTEVFLRPKMTMSNKYISMSPKQAVILAGGRGTRLMERTVDIPKPMIAIGDKTLLEHIIDIYSYQGIHEFLIPVGYKKEVIFDYFLRRFDGVRFQNDSGVTGQIGRNIISIIDTGLDTQTGGRIRRLRAWINGPFYMTYGDGLANVNIEMLREIFQEHGSDVTLTAVHPLPRFGSLKMYGDTVTEFGEKQEFTGLVNGGFMLMSPQIFDYIDGDETNLETDVLPELAWNGGMTAYRHDGFWHCCDTVRDVLTLEEIYKESGAEWLKIFG